MSDAIPAERIVLKILSGIQTGAEVSLPPGEYTIGSGEHDDIQFIDVSLKAGHGRLRVVPGKIEIAGGSGALLTVNGLRVLADSDEWQEVEPLDIITAGSIRFALGPPSANWTTLTEENETADDIPSGSRRGTSFGRSALATRISKWNIAQIAMPAMVLAALTVVSLAVWFLSAAASKPGTMKGEHNDVETVRTALDQLPFGKAVDLRQEVDGTIYGTGFVEANVERRAIIGAVEKTGVPVRLRLGVLQSLRNEIDNLILAEKVAVNATLSAGGNLTLDGVILNEDASTKFVERVKDAMVGLSRIDANIRTGKSLLGDIEKLGHMSQIDPWVLFRLDGDLIEATGSLPDERKDAWAGFLQSYSRRFSSDIDLRSFVHLQSAGGDAMNPITFGRGSNILDRMRNGTVDSTEIFAETRPALPRKVDPSPQSSNAPSEPPKVSADHVRERQVAVAALANVRTDLNRLDRTQITDKYLKNHSDQKSDVCRDGSQLTTANLPKALFWLDLLSVSNEMTLSAFEREEQAFILEAALDPTLAGDCLARSGVPAKAPSLYLAEASRNPDFVRFITRDFPTYAVDISGASLAAQRYLQLRDGQKLHEGAAPDAASELSLVGELGIVVKRKDGYAIVLYGRQMNWLNRLSAIYGSHMNWAAWN